MEMKMASSIVILIVSLMFADASYSKEPQLNPEGDSICNSCLEASRKAKGALRDMELFKEFDMLFSEVCNVLPANYEIQLQDERGCIACRRAVRELLMKMNQPKMKTKIIEALIDYCEEAEDNEEQCKRTVKKYIPTVLTKLEKLKPTDMCLMMGMCDEGIAFTNILD